jgi:hypothetical protein
MFRELRTRLTGDINRDSRVKLTELLIVAKNWE